MNRTELSNIIDSAIHNEEVVQFSYLPTTSPPPPQWRTLSPFEISEDGETVLGYDHNRAALRRFSLDRILDIETIDEEYVRPIDQEGL